MAKIQEVTVDEMTEFEAMLDHIQKRLAVHREFGQLRYFVEMSAAVAKEERRRMLAAYDRHQIGR